MAGERHLRQTNQQRRAQIRSEIILLRCFSYALVVLYVAIVISFIYSISSRMMKGNYFSYTYKLRPRTTAITSHRLLPALQGTVEWRRRSDLAAAESSHVEYYHDDIKLIQDAGPGADHSSKLKLEYCGYWAGPNAVTGLGFDDDVPGHDVINKLRPVSASGIGLKTFI
eukprot:g3912.t1